MRLYHHGTRFLPYKDTANDIEISSKNDGTKWGNMHPKKMIAVEVMTNWNRQSPSFCLLVITYQPIQILIMHYLFKYFSIPQFLPMNCECNQSAKFISSKKTFNTTSTLASWPFSCQLIINIYAGTHLQQMPRNDASLLDFPWPLSEQQNRHFRNTLKASTHN